MRKLNIKANRFWNSGNVRKVCIENNLYTLGTEDEYEHLLHKVNSMEPTYENLYTIARNINEHSDDQTITNIMFILEREAVITTFEIDGSDEI